MEGVIGCRMGSGTEAVKMRMLLGRACAQDGGSWSSPVAAVVSSPQRVTAPEGRTAKGSFSAGSGLQGGGPWGSGLPPQGVLQGRAEEPQPAEAWAEGQIPSQAPPAPEPLASPWWPA